MQQRSDELVRSGWYGRRTNFYHFMWSRRALSSLSHLETVERITVPDAKLESKASVIQTAWYWPRSRHRAMEQNREPRNPPTPWRSAHTWQRRQELQCSKDGLFSKWCWAAGEALGGSTVRGIRRLGVRVPVGTVPRLRVGSRSEHMLEATDVSLPLPFPSF